jgi:hypothetical protein
MISAPYMAPQSPFMTPQSPYMAPQPFSGAQPQPWVQALQPYMAQPSSSPSFSPSSSVTTPAASADSSSPAPNYGSINLFFAPPVGNNRGSSASTNGGDSFRRSGSQFASNPFASPQQQLVDSFQNAEKARNDYLNLANQLNGQAYQNQNAYPFGQNPFAANAYNPYMTNAYNPYAAQQFQQNLQNLQQQQMWQDQLRQQQQMQQMQQQQPQQPPMPPPQPQGLSAAAFPELNAMIAQPQTPDDKMQALNEVAMRGQGDVETYALLADSALTPTPGLAPEDADQIRRAALMALGTTAQAQNANVPVSELPGMDAIYSIIKNKNENPAVKAEAVRALRMIENPPHPISTDKKKAKIDKTVIQNLLKVAKKDKNPDIQSALTEPLMPPMAGGMMGGDMMGMPPGGMMGNPQAAY